MNALRNHIFVGVGLILLGCGQSGEVADSPDAAEIDGYSVLIDAIRQSGGSEEVVQSGRFQMTKTTLRRDPTPEEPQHRVETRRHLRAEVDEVPRGHSDEGSNSSVRNDERFVQTDVDDVDQLRFVFDRVTPFQRTAVTYQGTDSAGAVIDQCVRISGTRNRGQLLEEKEFVNHDVRWQPGDIDISEGSWFQESPTEFGRFRGRAWWWIMRMLRDDHASRSGLLDEETVRLGEALNRRLIRESNGMHGVRIVGREEIEESMCLIVETDDPGDTNLRNWIPQLRIWIDPERGFITPRIIELANGEPCVEYVSSHYQYLEDAGLWWPRVHQVSNHFEQTVTRYEIDLDRSCVNCPIDEAEFELAVVPGNCVSDDRDGHSEHLVIRKPYRMKFSPEGRLNFDSATDVAEKDPAYGYPSLEMLFSQTGMLPLLLINLAFGCLVLLVYRFRIRHV